MLSSTQPTPGTCPDRATAPPGAAPWVRKLADLDLGDREAAGARGVGADEVEHVAALLEALGLDLEAALAAQRGDRALAEHLLALLDLGGDEGQRLEIGRASCRERG